MLSALATSAGVPMADESAGKKYPPLMTRALVREANSELVIREFDFDYNSRLRRIWLFKTLVWALTNHKSIELIAIADDKD